MKVEEQKEEQKEEPVAQPEVTEEATEEIELEYTTRSDYISAAYFAISSVEGIDTQIMSKEDAKRIKRIIRKSIMIIDDCIGEMYNELYEDDTED